MASGDALMPIRPEYRWFYPIDWPQLSAAIRLVAQRAGASIAFAHTALVFHLGDGRWWDEEAATWRNGRGWALSLPTHPLISEDDRILTTKVVLATAHLDHEQQQKAQSQSLLSMLPHVA
jgi:hypothetical protein